METLKIITPFLTFTLGVISTIIFKRLDKKKEYLGKSLDEVRDLVNAWYNQLHEIYVDLKISPTIEKPSKFIFYINNRLILPKLLHHLEVLRKYKKANKVVFSTEEFLSLVTNYNKSFNDNSVSLSDDNQDRQSINTANSSTKIKENEQLPTNNDELLMIVGHTDPETDFTQYLNNDIELNAPPKTALLLSCNDILSGVSIEKNYSILELLLIDLDKVLQKLSKEIADIKN